MMYELMIRFKIISLDRIIETRLDTRLSFKANFCYLHDLIDIDLEDVKIYDPNKNIFLDENVEISKYNIAYYITLHLFT